MVKMPRQVKRYSPSAGKHTMHTIELLNYDGVSAVSVELWLVTVVSHVQSLTAVKSQQSELTFSTVAQKLVRLTMRRASVLRNSN
jgi:hypothetical protein